VLQQDPPPAVTLDQGPTAVRATAGTMGLGPPVRRSITAPLGTIPAQLLGRPAITLDQELSRVPVTEVTPGPVFPVLQSTTALGETTVLPMPPVTTPAWNLHLRMSHWI